jgi:EAL domain-containing protein (putative c-di-GMP-specific phosphodiesterase class I)/GGDEF domain-containing protein
MASELNDQPESNVVVLKQKVGGTSMPVETSTMPEVCPTHARLGEALSRSRFLNGHSVLMVYRLCGYRELVETFGETMGTQVMQRTEDSLRHGLRGDDTLHQIAADEFAIVPGRLALPADSASMAERLLEGAIGSCGQTSHSPWVKATVGIAVQDSSTDQVSELIRCARIALHRVTGDYSTCYAFYSEALLKSRHHNFWMEVELQQALEENRYRLHYQPQFALGGTEVVSVEALVRLETRSGELIPPNEFIGLAEDNGMIVALGNWVIREACQQLARWRRAGYTVRRMAVNVSPRQLENEALLNVIDEAISSSGLSYSDLELELTERCVLEYTPRVESVFEMLRDRGVRIAVDDFGTGYSSFANLVKQPLDVLKLDSSLVADVASDPRARRVVSMIIAMARELDLELIAEGVETPEQRQFLEDSGCSMAQGFGLAKPEGAAVIEKLLSLSVSQSA